MLLYALFLGHIMNLIQNSTEKTIMEENCVNTGTNTKTVVFHGIVLGIICAIMVLHPYISP